MSTDVSRSGRVRKKSAKLLEMEEVEKTDGPPKQHNNSTSSTHRSSLLSNGTDQETPRKSKKLKIKFSLDDGGVEELPIDNEILQSDYLQTEPTVPSLKIKLFSQNSGGK